MPPSGSPPTIHSTGLTHYYRLPRHITGLCTLHFHLINPDSSLSASRQPRLLLALCTLTIPWLTRGSLGPTFRGVRRLYRPLCFCLLHAEYILFWYHHAFFTQLWTPLCYTPSHAAKSNNYYERKVLRKWAFLWLGRKLWQWDPWFRVKSSTVVFYESWKSSLRWRDRKV